MKVILGSDHAGYEMKEGVKKYLMLRGVEVTDKGTFSTASVDYPDFAHAVAKEVDNGTFEHGLLFCGSGNGVCITANKYANVRAALCWTEEIALLAIQHNNANILCIPARFITLFKAKLIAKALFKGVFEGGRHQTRIDKIKSGLLEK